MTWGNARKMKKFKLVILVLLVFISSLGYGQSLRKADALYNNRAYLEAAEIYTKLPKTTAILEKLGDCWAQL